MSLSAGIVGLPNVGKSTLFNAITNSKVEAANYPFATIEPNVGIVKLKDSRIDLLSKLIDPEKTIYSSFEFIDIAGLVEGASQGEGLGNKFLSNIRNVDAIVHVVRCFQDKNITHIFNDVNPIRDAQIIEYELLIADLQVLERHVDRSKGRALHSTDKKAKEDFLFFSRILDDMRQEKFLKELDLSEDELEKLKPFNFLTLKPMIYVGNIDEEFIANPNNSEGYKKLVEYANNKKIEVIPISSKIEQEISELSEEEQKAFLEDIGINESGLSLITRKAFKALNLSTFFTVGKKEVRSWTFRTNSLAPECAGEIHTDFQKGFIKVEIIKYDDFIKYGSEAKVKEAGKIMIEGKNYVVQDGDICNFRFNV